MRALAAEPESAEAALELDFERRAASVAGENLYLSDREFALLAALQAGSEQLLTYEELLEEAFGDAPGASRRVLDAAADRLRRKLELRGAEGWLSGEPGVGLVLNVPGEESGLKGGQRWAPIC